MASIEPKPATCEDCGTEYIKTGRRQPRCSECSRARRLSRRRDNKREARINSGDPIVGSIIRCKSCDAEFEKREANHVYCEECGTRRAKKLRSKEKTGNWGEPPQAARERAKRYRFDNPEKVKAKNIEWSKSESGRKFYREREAKRRLNPVYKLQQRIGQQIRVALKGGKAGRSTSDIVPFSFDELRPHIERQFTRGMSWGNMDRWHIDHIVPKASFKFSSHTDDEFKACWALTNLRPLWGKENQEKSDKRIFLL